MIDNKDRAKMAENRGLRYRANMMCKDCIYDPKEAGNWRQQVQNCTVSLCPLYEKRPTSSAPAASPPS